MKHIQIILGLVLFATVSTFAQSPRIKLNQITKDTVKGSVLISNPSDSGMVYSRDLFISYGADTTLILYGDTVGKGGTTYNNISEDADTVFISDRLDIYNPNRTAQLTLSGPRARFFMYNDNGAGDYSQLSFGESTTKYADMAWYNNDDKFQIFSFGDIEFSTQYVAPNVIPNLWIDVDDGFVGMGVKNPTHPLEMGSGAHVTTGGTWTNASDVKLKNNINYIYPYGLSQVMNLKPVVFDYINGEKNTLGFIAQDVYEYIPEAISSTLDKYGNETMGLKMVSITATLTKAIQEQQAIIESQANEIETLKTLITELSNRLQILENN